MTKLKQKIIVFISPSDQAFERPTSICNLYMNRFAIEEEAGSEILKIYQFKPGVIEDKINERQLLHNGTGLILN